MNTLPPNLPDVRTAQRLLDLLSQLENMGYSVPSPPPVSMAEAAELATLRAQNAQLKHRQEVARQRLNALATRLEQTRAEEMEAAEEEAA